jgi:hypothetical protein
VSAAAQAGRLDAGARSRPVEPPRLRLVASAPLTAGRLPFAVLVSAVLAAGLLALLMLHTLAAQDAFRVHDLQRRAAALADTEQQLAVAVEQAQAPADLAARARRLGMVPAGAVAFIRLRDGRMVGVAHAALPPPPPASPSTSPSPSASASASASASTSPSPATSGAAPSPAPRASTGASTHTARSGATRAAASASPAPTPASRRR